MQTINTDTAVLTGSERQVEWANKIRANVLQYIDLKLQFYNEQLTRYTDPDDVEQINYNIAQIKAKLEKLNQVRQARIFIDYFQQFSTFLTKEDFAIKNPKLAGQTLDQMYELTRDQIAGFCRDTLLKCPEI